MAGVEMGTSSAGQKALGENKQPGQPAWLASLLAAKFFEPCAAHLDVAKKNECNQFCVDCSSAAGNEGGAIFCSLCLPEHTDHHVFQIRRSSYHDVVRRADLVPLLDVSKVQTYVMNAHKVVFLNERPLAREHDANCVGDAGACTECRRALMDAKFRFCSLGCKLKGMASDPSLTIARDPKRKRESEGEGEGDLPGSSKSEKTEQTSYRRRPRKGVHRKPERSHFY